MSDVQTIAEQILLATERELAKVGGHIPSNARENALQSIIQAFQQVQV